MVRVQVTPPHETQQPCFPSMTLPRASHCLFPPYVFFLTMHMMEQKTWFISPGSFFSAPHVASCDALCVLTTFCLNEIEVFSSLCYSSSSVGLNHTGQPSVSTRAERYAKNLMSHDLSGDSLFWYFFKIFVAVVGQCMSVAAQSFIYGVCFL